MTRTPPVNRALEPDEWRQLRERKISWQLNGDGAILATEAQRAGRVGTGRTLPQAIHDLDPKLITTDQEN